MREQGADDGARTTEKRQAIQGARSWRLRPYPGYKRSEVEWLRETTRIDALIAKVREAIDLLKEYRTVLISAAVTGKIDVREEAA